MQTCSACTHLASHGPRGMRTGQTGTLLHDGPVRLRKMGLRELLVLESSQFRIQPPPSSKVSHFVPKCTAVQNFHLFAMQCKTLSDTDAHSGMYLMLPDTQLHDDLLGDSFHSPRSQVNGQYSHAVVESCHCHHVALLGVCRPS
jgi:hypothetical protein